MAHSYHHAVSSARTWGGDPSDYQAIHDWLDGSKLILADFRTPCPPTSCRGMLRGGGAVRNDDPDQYRPARARKADCGAAHPGRPRAHPLLRGLGPMHPAGALDGPTRRAPHRE